jgi:hypothetical protein
MLLEKRDVDVEYVEYVEYVIIILSGLVCSLSAILCLDDLCDMGKKLEG